MRPRITAISAACGIQVRSIGTCSPQVQATAAITAMIAVHAQQTVVSTLLDILGYIPDMPKSKGH